MSDGIASEDDELLIDIARQLAQETRTQAHTRHLLAECVRCKRTLHLAHKFTNCLDRTRHCSAAMIEAFEFVSYKKKRPDPLKRSMSLAE